MKLKKLKLRTCNRCNWVYMGVSREFAETEVKDFNKYYNSLTKKEQKEYYGGKKSNIKHYEFCDLCGNKYDNFRVSKAGDCPDGCTISPIIYEPKTKVRTRGKKNE